MQGIRRGSWIVVGLLVAALLMASAPQVVATTSKSSNYEVSEAEFGAGAALETCSGSYCARATIGTTASGDSSSANYTAAFGPLENEDEPVLEFFVEPGESTLGELAIDRTATRTMLLHVRNHMVGGYIVQVTGDPPSYEGHSLTAPSTPTASSQGSEQFAPNVVANTLPEIGSDPLSMPDETASRGLAMPKYATPNLFAYTNGDIVARDISESSQIRYTISMIVNVSGKTPAGHYAGDFSAIVTPAF